MSLVGSKEKVPIKIFRDTGAKGMALNVISAPLHRIQLFSGLVQGVVSVSVRAQLPIPIIDVILGNYLARDRVWVEVELPNFVTQLTVSCPWLPNTGRGHSHSPEVRGAGVAT